jgi:fumarate reductase iron-sulfur subunit
MKLKICDKTYDLEKTNIKVDNLLSVLLELKALQNSSLSFRSGCRSGVCGSCAVRVNGIEKLACKTKIKEGDDIQPLKNSKVIKDLIVDLSNQDRFLIETKAFLSEKNDETVTAGDEKKIDRESNCILCSSCLSSCPVYEVNENFTGPFALTRAFRYINDKKESDQKTKIDAVQSNGVWDCTLCGNCNMVCPAHIDIKNDIMQLRNKSAQFGYTNPNITNFDMGFNQDFGFDPNGF